MRKTLLPDINVWLALTFDQHVHHLTAKNWAKGVRGDVIRFCRFTQQGFLRLATNPKVMGEQTVSLVDAWKLYDAILTDERIEFAAEPTNIEMTWRQMTQVDAKTPNTWSDAYLAAFSVASGYELVTFDRGFAKFAGLAWTKLD